MGSGAGFRDWGGEMRRLWRQRRLIMAVLVGVLVLMPVTGAGASPSLPAPSSRAALGLGGGNAAAGSFVKKLLALPRPTDPSAFLAMASKDPTGYAAFLAVYAHMAESPPWLSKAGRTVIG